MEEDDLLVESVVDGRYLVVRKVAEGGMSVIYEAQHTKLATRSFALKALRVELSSNQEANERFEREAELLATMRHPNVVDISDWVYLPDGRPCMVLEYMHGAALLVRLQRGSLPWDMIARIGDQCCSALTLAHRMGITHRDLKPENIFISIDDVGEERVKLLDFGVSKLRGVGRLSGQYKMLGTPSYMSPEQAQGLTDQIGPATDVWAMGAILYEMATQRVAFAAEDLEGTLGLIIAGQRDPVNKWRPDAPGAFIELIDRALSPDPARRIQTIDDLRAALKAALDRPVASSPRLQLKTPVGGMAAQPRPPQPTPGIDSILPPQLQPAGPMGGTGLRLSTEADVEDPKRKLWMTVGLVVVVATVLNVVIAVAL